MAVSPAAAMVVWSAGLAAIGLPVVWRTLRGVARGRLAADLVAMLAIVAALLFAEPLAGLIVVLMQTGMLPAQKVPFVQRLVKEGERVLMVGDGTNDAPALSSATVGIALASGGGGITAEAADAVLLADDPTRLLDAIAISRHTPRLARESI
jgi:cation transport ATPase